MFTQIEHYGYTTGPDALKGCFASKDTIVRRSVCCALQLVIHKPNASRATLFKSMCVSCRTHASVFVRVLCTPLIQLIQLCRSTLLKPLPFWKWYNPVFRLSIGVATIGIAREKKSLILRCSVFRSHPSSEAVGKKCHVSTSVPLEHKSPLNGLVCEGCREIAKRTLQFCN